MRRGSLLDRRVDDDAVLGGLSAAGQSGVGVGAGRALLHADSGGRVGRGAARRGIPVILDLGFTTRAARARFAGLARDAGLAPKLHFIDVPADERWRRVEARNAAGSGNLDFAISRSMFDYVEAMWKRPTRRRRRECA